MNYPINLITSYRSGKISKQKFLNDFAQWQKLQGFDFNCKGFADKSGFYLFYRNEKAEVKNGFLFWKTTKSESVFQFKRKVDFAKCKKEI